MRVGELIGDRDRLDRRARLVALRRRGGPIRRGRPTSEGDHLPCTWWHRGQGRAARLVPVLSARPVAAGRHGDRQLPAGLRERDARDAVARREPRNRLAPDLLVEGTARELHGFGWHGRLHGDVNWSGRGEARSERFIAGAREGKDPALSSANRELEGRGPTTRRSRKPAQAMFLICAQEGKDDTLLSTNRKREASPGP